MTQNDTFEKLKYPDIVDRAKTEIKRLDLRRTECLDKLEADLLKFQEVDLDITRHNLAMALAARLAILRVLGEHK